jgi:hypothetical protein
MEGQSPESGNLFMPEKSQDIDASGVSVAKMSSEEIDAALDELTAEVKAQTGESAAEASDNRPPEPVSEQTPAVTPLPEDNPTAVQPAPENPATPVDADAEAALNRIDQDLADLESLLAETTTDGTSETASRMAASQEAAKARAEAEQLAAEADENAEGSDNAAEAEGSTEPTDSGLLEETSAEEAEPESSDESPPQATDEASAPPAETPSVPVEAAAPAPPAAPAAEVPLTLQARLRIAAASVVVTPFVIMDAPFAKLSPRFKTLLGLVGIATLVTAIATWVLGSLR